MEASKVMDGKKFMWDGGALEDEGAARAAADGYRAAGFEARVVEDEGRYHVFTRKAVTEVKVEGAPPA